MKTGLKFLAISILVLADPCFAQKTSEVRHMRFGYTILYVSNLAATLTFYEKAFGFEPGISIEGQYAELKTGTTTLAFAQEDFVKTLTNQPFTPADASKPAPPVELGFVTDAVQVDFDRAIAAGAIEVKKPEMKPWGQTVGYVRDLNGFLVEICTPIKMES